MTAADAKRPSREARLLANVPTGDQPELPPYADLVRGAQARDLTAGRRELVKAGKGGAR